MPDPSDYIRRNLILSSGKSHPVGWQKEYPSDEIRWHIRRGQGALGWNQLNQDPFLSEYISDLLRPTNKKEGAFWNLSTTPSSAPPVWGYTHPEAAYTQQLLPLGAGDSLEVIRQLQAANAPAPQSLRPQSNRYLAVNPVEVHSSKGNFNYLSNFADVGGEGEVDDWGRKLEDGLEFQGRRYRTVEGAYQANKSGQYVEGFEDLSGPEARKKGSSIKADTQINRQLMKELVRKRGEQDPEFRRQLEMTGEAPITHSVADKYWASEFPKILDEVRGTAFLTQAEKNPYSIGPEADPGITVSQKFRTTNEFGDVVETTEEKQYRSAGTPFPVEPDKHDPYQILQRVIQANKLRSPEDFPRAKEGEYGMREYLEETASLAAQDSSIIDSQHTQIADAIDEASRKARVKVMDKFESHVKEGQNIPRFGYKDYKLKPTPTELENWDKDFRILKSGSGDPQLNVPKLPPGSLYRRMFVDTAPNQGSPWPHIFEESYPNPYSEASPVGGPRYEGMIAEDQRARSSRFEPWDASMPSEKERGYVTKLSDYARSDPSNPQAAKYRSIARFFSLLNNTPEDVVSEVQSLYQDADLSPGEKLHEALQSQQSSDDPLSDKDEGLFDVLPEGRGSVITAEDLNRPLTDAEMSQLLNRIERFYDGWANIYTTEDNMNRFFDAASKGRVSWDPENNKYVAQDHDILGSYTLRQKTSVENYERAVIKAQEIINKAVAPTGKAVTPEAARQILTNAYNTMAANKAQREGKSDWERVTDSEAMDRFGKMAAQQGKQKKDLSKTWEALSGELDLGPVPTQRYSGVQRIHSGGQVGADQQGLIAAREAGLDTGGIAPKDYIVSDPSRSLSLGQLKDFGLTEVDPYDTLEAARAVLRASKGYPLINPGRTEVEELLASGRLTYPPRTRANVDANAATVYFGDKADTDSPGRRATRRAASDIYGTEGPASGWKPKNYFEVTDLSDPKQQQAFADWLVENNIRNLNVAGSRNFDNQEGMNKFMQIARDPGRFQASNFNVDIWNSIVKNIETEARTAKTHPSFGTDGEDLFVDIPEKPKLYIGEKADKPLRSEPSFEESWDQAKQTLSSLSLTEPMENLSRFSILQNMDRLEKERANQSEYPQVPVGRPSDFATDEAYALADAELAIRNLSGLEDTYAKGNLLQKMAEDPNFRSLSDTDKVRHLLKVPNLDTALSTEVDISPYMGRGVSPEAIQIKPFEMTPGRFGHGSFGYGREWQRPPAHLLENVLSPDYHLKMFRLGSDLTEGAEPLQIVPERPGGAAPNPYGTGEDFEMGDKSNLEHEMDLRENLSKIEPHRMKPKEIPNRLKEGAVKAGQTAKAIGSYMGNKFFETPGAIASAAESAIRKHNTMQRTPKGRAKANILSEFVEAIPSAYAEAEIKKGQLRGWGGSQEFDPNKNSYSWLVSQPRFIEGVRGNYGVEGVKVGGLYSQEEASNNWNTLNILASQIDESEEGEERNKLISKFEKLVDKATNNPSGPYGKTVQVLKRTNWGDLNPVQESKAVINLNQPDWIDEPESPDPGTAYYTPFLSNLTGRKYDPSEMAYPLAESVAFSASNPVSAGSYIIEMGSDATTTGNRSLGSLQSMGLDSERYVIPQKHTIRLRHDAPMNKLVGYIRGGEEEKRERFSDIAMAVPYTHRRYWLYVDENGNAVRMNSNGELEEYAVMPPTGEARLYNKFATDKHMVKGEEKITPRYIPVKDTGIDRYEGKLRNQLRYNWDARELNEYKDSAVYSIDRDTSDPFSPFSQNRAIENFRRTYDGLTMFTREDHGHAPAPKPKLTEKAPYRGQRRGDDPLQFLRDQGLIETTYSPYQNEPGFDRFGNPKKERAGYYSPGSYARPQSGEPSLTLGEVGDAYSKVQERAQKTYSRLPLWWEQGTRAVERYTPHQEAGHTVKIYFGETPEVVPFDRDLQESTLYNDPLGTLFRHSTRWSEDDARDAEGYLYKAMGKE
tara:strand:+ start:842 stop:6727 length:5886 start_codon:yes stop_codon:yes gene_type:complete